MSRRIGVAHHVRRSRPPVTPGSAEGAVTSEWLDLVATSDGTPPSARLQAFGTHPKRALSQSFLTSQTDIAAIVSAAKLGPNDVVVEIGPGLGALTRLLVERCRQVIAIEIDDVLAGELATQLGSPANLVVHHEDALTMDWSAIVAEPFILVASLPYHIATPMLHQLLYRSPRPQRAVVMVQDEVAHRLAPERAAMSYMGITTALMADAHIVRRVPPTAFFPVPKIWSAIVRLDLHEPTLPASQIEGFLRLVRAGFTQPRKQLHNSLAQGLSLTPSAAAALVTAARIPVGRRPGELSLPEWGALLAVCGGLIADLATPDEERHLAERGRAGNHLTSTPAGNAVE